jgi:hypothetical protein
VSDLPLEAAVREQVIDAAHGAAIDHLRGTKQWQIDLAYKVAAAVWERAGIRELVNENARLSAALVEAEQREQAPPHDPMRRYPSCEPHGRAAAHLGRPLMAGNTVREQAVIALLAKEDEDRQRREDIERCNREREVEKDADAMAMVASSSLATWFPSIEWQLVSRAPHTPDWAVVTEVGNIVLHPRPSLAFRVERRAPSPAHAKPRYDIVLLKYTGNAADPWSTVGRVQDGASVGRTIASERL